MKAKTQKTTEKITVEKIRINSDKIRRHIKAINEIVAAMKRNGVEVEFSISENKSAIHNPTISWTQLF